MDPFPGHSRRDFIRLLLQAGAAVPVFSMLGSCDEPYRISYDHIRGMLMGAASSTGHMLREKKFPELSGEEEHDIVIAGGGISAFSAARRLAASGLEKVCLLELADRTGGNSVYGENTITKYPWGAHYLPLPETTQQELIAFLQELGVITGFDEKGIPVYDEFSLCHDPQERLFINHRWQEGIIPEFGLGEKELKQVRRFLALMEEMKQARGGDGKFAFALPVDASSSDVKFVSLDQLTMREWMRREKFDSATLDWYVDYCCRDDFGTAAEETSAWAGIHYFAARRGQAANAESSTVLTWPEGNGYLADALRKQFRGEVRLQSLVYNIETAGDRVLVDYYDVVRKKSIRINAKQCIVSMPQYVAGRVLKNCAEREAFSRTFTYSPWMVANVTLSRFPDDRGVQLSWDNVLYGSKSLGYVNACQQHTDLREKKKVVTFYLPFTGADPKKARQEIYARQHADWVKIVTDELEYAHPGISGLITGIDVWVWGHAMVRPVKGLVHGEARKKLREPVDGKIFFAHSDLGGISVFEEAFYQGIRAAKELLETRKHT